MEEMILKKNPEIYTGYVPTKARELPKMFIDPTEEELKEMIRKAIKESITLKQTKKNSRAK